MIQNLKRLQRGAAVALLTTFATMGLGTSNASAGTTEMTYLLPAPAGVIAFAPLMLAQNKGYYEDEGLKVNFVTVKGGADVGKQLGAGNAELGGALGDTPIILRQNDIPVKGVALLGGGALHQMMMRKDANVNAPADLKDKSITVMSYQDTSFYATLAVLAQAGLTRADADIQAAGPVGIWQLVASGKAQGMIGAPENGAMVEAEGIPMTWQSTGDYFPGMAQAVLASEEMIAKNPALVQKFVNATLKAFKEVRDNPAQAAKEYVSFMPSYKGREAFVEKVLTYYANNVYADQETVGRFDPQRVSSLQDFYLDQEIIRNRIDLNNLFTNEFVQNAGQ
ncbi:ABC transporter substrate-binding protein [Neopusillimonas maritima]|nr:ABC transporter substrate-binding protein [Neopusillimonas maritima]